MRKTIVFIMMLLLLPLHNAWGESEVSSAHTGKIVVYRNGATIVKTATVSVKKGNNSTKLTGLTSALADDSLQAALEEKNGVRISDVKIEKTFLQGVTQEMVKDLRKRIEEIEGQIKDNAAVIAAISSSIDFLKKTDPFGKNQKAAATEIEGHARFLETSLTADFQKIARFEVATQKLTDEKLALEKELKKAGAERRESKTIFVNIHSDEAAKLNLLISYTVKNAGWSPVYDVRADSTSGKIDIASMAVITQSTGEDWTDAAVEISTASPSHGPPPELAPWYVNIHEPPVFRKAARAVQTEMMAMAAAPDAVDSGAAPMPEMKTEATSFSFSLPGTVTIPSDNQPHRVNVAALSTNANLDYYAVPKLLGRAYLKANFKNPFLFPISSGIMNVFLDGRFVGAAPVIRQILPDGDMELSCGVDESVKVERRLIKKFTEYSGVLSPDTHVLYEFATTVANGKTREIAITVNDHFPVSRNEKIKVVMESPTKEEAAIAEDGMISWRLKLKPGEIKPLKTKFSVTYPKGTLVRRLE
jgi:uncharacterized protein (TIGR02231 family)